MNNFALTTAIDKRENTKRVYSRLVEELRKNRQRTGKTLNELMKEEHEQRCGSIIKKSKYRKKNKQEPAAIADKQQAITMNADNTITLTMEQLRALLGGK